ncbi:MAG TPA: hypothetical protein VG426_06550, partial [Candidatus Dormibacteraeota bacterium]|nr:hypothetical protein [Candidatus Dormibacteraeota bacterium]
RRRSCATIRKPGKSSPSLIEASGWIVTTEPSFVNDSQQCNIRAQGLPVNSSFELQCFPPFEVGERLQPIDCVEELHRLVGLVDGPWWLA